LAALSFTRVNVRDPLARLSNDSANSEAPKDKDSTKSERQRRKEMASNSEKETGMLTSCWR